LDIEIRGFAVHADHYFQNLDD